VYTLFRIAARGKYAMADSISDRLDQVVKEKLGGNWAELARLSGLTPSTLQGVKDGKDPRANTLLRISAVVGVTVDWLLTGEGPMYRSQIAAPAGRSGLSPTYAEEAPPIDQTVINTARLLEDLTPTQRREIFDDIEEKKRLNTIERELDELRQVVSKIAG
jgi:transcriptional regulator with XRE-family HTH domain